MLVWPVMERRYTAFAAVPGQPGVTPFSPVTSRATSKKAPAGWVVLFNGSLIETVLIAAVTFAVELLHAVP
ncbi:MAG: hypothetical protein ACXVII_26840 [Solirubrobacteraceae bacterium]